MTYLKPTLHRLGLDASLAGCCTPTVQIQAKPLYLSDCYVPRPIDPPVS